MKKIIIDQEQDLFKEDFLNTKEYAKTLQGLIESADKDIPLTVGLFGEWGSGKSSIINTVKNKLESNKGYTTKFIIYDAWKYSNDSFRRMFLKKVQEELKLEKTTLMNSFYTNTNEEIDINREPNYHFWIYAVVAFGIAMILGFKLGISDQWGFTLTILISIVGVALTNYSKFFNEFKVSVQKPLVFAPEQFEEGFKEILIKGLKKKNVLDKIDSYIKGEGTKNYERIVIVIDNIDRCHKDVAYDLLTNTKNFIENGLNVVFLIPVDDAALKRHIFKNDGGDTKEGEEFLRKYFNLTMRIKPYKLTEIYDYALKLNEINDLGLLPDTINIIAKEYASNPRRILQFFNNLQLEIDLLENKYSTEFVKQNEKLICKFLVIREEWPEYYKELSNSPSNFLEEKNGVDDTKISEDLVKFLRDTKVITNNVDFVTLQKILVNSDKFGEIPESLLNILDEEKIEDFEQEVSNLNLKISDIVDSQLTSLESAIYRKLDETDVPIILNRIVFILNNHNNLDIYLDNKLETFLSRNADFSNVFTFSATLANLVRYSVHIKTKGKNYLNQAILSLLDQFKNETEFNAFGGQLYDSFAKESELEDLTKIKNLFDLYFLFKNKSVEGLQLNSQRLTILFDKDFIEDNMKDADVFLEDETNFKNWQFLAGNLEKQTDLLNVAIDYSYSIASVGALTEDRIFNISKRLLSLFKVSQNAELTSNLSLDNLNDLFFYDVVLRPTYSSAATNYLDMIEANSVPTILEYFLECERLSNGTTKIADRFLDFYNRFQNEFELVLLHYTSNYNNVNFYGLRSIVMDFSEMSETQIKIIGNVIFRSALDTYIYSDDEISVIIQSIINKYISSENFERFVDIYIENDRTISIAKKILSALPITQIETLPSKLRILTIDKLTESEVLEGLFDNLELIKFIAINGEQSHQEKLIPYLKVKINTPDAIVVDISLEVIGSLNMISKQESNDLLGQLTQNSVSRIANKELLTKAKSHLESIFK